MRISGIWVEDLLKMKYYRLKYCLTAALLLIVSCTRYTIVEIQCGIREPYVQWEVIHTDTVCSSSGSCMKVLKVKIPKKKAEIFY